LKRIISDRIEFQSKLYLPVPIEDTTQQGSTHPYWAKSSHSTISTAPHIRWDIRP